MTLLVLDMGGTFIKYGYWENNHINNVQKFKTPTSYTDLKKNIQQLINDSKRNIQGLAISAPGVVDQNERIIKGISAIPYIHHFPIFDDLESSLNLPVYIENDANCAGFSEMTHGVGTASENAVFIILGTGVGGSIFINRKLYKGTNNFAGEFGLSLTTDGALSYTGSIVKASHQYSQLASETVNGEELFKRKEKGDKLATELIEKFYNNLAEFLYNIQVILDPDLIAIGGGVSAQKEISEVLEMKLKAKLQKNELENFMPKIKTCQYANTANLIGAAAFFEQSKKENENVKVSI